MKKKLTIAALVLAVSVVGTSAYAANDIVSSKTIKSSIAQVSANVSLVDSSNALSADEAAKLGDITNYDQIAKDKGITKEELFAQLEKEGKMTKTIVSTESEQAKEMIKSTLASEITKTTSSSEAVSLETMAKEQGITTDELIAQLEKEGKLMKAELTTKSTEVEKSNE